MDINEKIKLTRDVIIITGIFCAFTAMLLLLNYFQMSRHEPLESEALKILVERLTADPGNEELKTEIRNLDLLARKAYFTARWQVNTGAWLLLAGSVVLAVAIWYNRKLLSKIDIPVQQDQPELSARLITRKWLLTAGGLFFAIALAVSFFSKNYLDIYKQESPESSIAVKDKVEVIPVIKTKTESSDEVVSSTSDLADSLEAVPAIVHEEATATVAEARTAVPVKLTEELIKGQHNSFRGPFGQGISYMKNIPVDWNGGTGKNIIWKTNIPKSGFNSPVIWNDRLFLAGADEESRVVYCLDRNSGKILWERKVTGIPGSPDEPPDVTDDTGLAAPSLTVDGTGVYAIFGTGDLIAFNFEGNRLWARNLGVPDNHYGHSSSLIVWDNKVIVQYDTNKGGRLLAIHTATGDPVWDIRRNSRISWASPVLIPLESKYQIITTGDPLVAAHDIQTGKELWSVNCMMGEVGPSVAYSEGLVFAANEYAKLAAIQTGSNAVILWEDNEYLPEAASPVASQGLLFLATSYGVIVCYDMKSGEKQWEHDAGKGFYSSPVIADGKLYVIDLGGKMYIFKVASQKTVLGEPVLGENAYATPAFTDGRIYIRGEKNMYCIGVK